MSKRRLFFSSKHSGAVVRATIFIDSPLYRTTTGAAIISNVRRARNLYRVRSSASMPSRSRVERSREKLGVHALSHPQSSVDAERHGRRAPRVSRENNCTCSLRDYRNHLQPLATSKPAQPITHPPAIHFFISIRIFSFFPKAHLRPNDRLPFFFFSRLDTASDDYVNFSCELDSRFSVRSSFHHFADFWDLSSHSDCYSEFDASLASMLFPEQLVEKRSSCKRRRRKIGAFFNGCVFRR